MARHPLKALVSPWSPWQRPLKLKQPLPAWRPEMLDAYAEDLAERARDFFTHAIEPTCLSLAKQLDALSQGKTDEAMDARENSRLLQMEVHRSFLLGLGALWERNFRALLRHSAYATDPAKHEDLKKGIDGAGWEGAETAFSEIRGFTLDWFPMRDDLLILHSISSAIRHGDGKSAKALQGLMPGLFLEHDVRTGFHAWFTFAGESPAAINKLDITLELLAHFTEVVASFWDAVEILRRAGAEAGSA